MVLEPLLTPARSARLVAFADRQANALSLPDVVDAVLTRTWRAPRDADARHQTLRRVSERVALDSLMMLGAHADTSPEVRAYVLDQIATLGDSLGARRDSTNPIADAHYRQAARDIARYLEDPAAHAPKSVLMWGSRPRSRYPLPPGPPLG
jgi:hypothetical protein